jgi:hypothetical protein
MINLAALTDEELAALVEAGCKALAVGAVGDQRGKTGLALDHRQAAGEREDKPAVRVRRG